MKRAVSISLVIVLVLGLFASCQKKSYGDGTTIIPSTFISTEQNESFIYDVYEDYTIVKEYIGEDFRVTIPKKLGGKVVRGIGDNAIGKSMLAIEVVDIPKDVEYIEPNAFYGCHSITAFTVAESNPVFKSEKGIVFSKDGKSLLYYPPASEGDSYSVPSGVESIGAYAFGDNERIVTVKLPDSVKSIGSHAFDGCNKLVNINIPAGVTEITPYCFYECASLPEAELPDSLTKIGEHAFDYCISFSEVTIPDNVNEICDGAYFRCETLRKAVLPASLAKYGFKVFTGCRLLDNIEVSGKSRTYKSTEGVLYSYDGKTLVEYPYGKYDKEISIDSSVTEVRAYAFYRDEEGDRDSKFDNILSINFSKVEKIGAYAFANRNAITEVNLPSTLKEISSTAFNNCKKIEKYSIKDNGNYVTPDGVLFTKDKKTLVAYPTNREKNIYDIPEGTENIADYAFSYCYSLQEISIPESLITVGDYGFYMTSTIVGTVKFGKNLKSIGKYCFSHCAGIEELTFTDNTITEIPQGAFEVFDGALDFMIPEGVTKIGEDAFRETAYITYIKIPSTVKQIDKRAFYDMDDLHDLLIPEGVETIGEEIVTIMDESNPDKVTLKVYEGSTGEKYAKDNNIPYKLV